MTVFEAVRAYHETHGDDFGSEKGRVARYEAILSMLDLESWHTLLDVGCGERRFAEYVGCAYQGIDLLDGQNVMDWDEQADWVVAGGITYKLPDAHEAHVVLGKCWELCRKGFIFTSLSSYAHFCEGELTLDPFEMARWADKRANGIRLDMSYKAGDFAIAMFR